MVLIGSLVVIVFASPQQRDSSVGELDPLGLLVKRVEIGDGCIGASKVNAQCSAAEGIVLNAHFVLCNIRNFRSGRISDEQIARFFATWHLQSDALERTVEFIDFVFVGIVGSGTVGYNMQG